MQSTQLNLKSIVIFLVLLILTFLCFKGCGEKSRSQVENNKYKKSNDSLNVIYQKSILKIENYERDLTVLHNDLIKAKNEVKITESKYLLLKKKMVKPKYIETIADCNDTIQSIYKRSVEKDSICDVVIVGKNDIISKQDTVIATNELEKIEFVKLVDLKQNENKNLESIILNDNKEIRNEKTKKNVWKISSLALIGVILKMVILK